MNNSLPNSVEIVDNHLNQFFDEDEDILVFDEIESEVIHRDIFFIKAKEQRVSYTVKLWDKCFANESPRRR